MVELELDGALPWLDTKNKIKRRTVACDHCRKHKQKCSGDYPCFACQKKGLQCVVSERKKRGPPAATSNRTKRANTGGGGLNLALPASMNPHSMGRLEMLDFYMTHLCTIPFCLEKERMLWPQNKGQELQLYAGIASAARRMERPKVADEFLSHARRLAGELFDDPSIDTVKGFVNLGESMLEDDFVRSIYYYSSAARLARMCSSGLPNIVDVMIGICSTFGEMSSEERLKFMDAKLNFMYFNPASQNDPNREITIMSYLIEKTYCEILHLCGLNVWYADLGEATADENVGLHMCRKVFENRGESRFFLKYLEREDFERLYSQLSAMAGFIPCVKHKLQTLGRFTVDFVHMLFWSLRAILHWRVGDSNQAFAYARKCFSLLEPNRVRFAPIILCDLALMPLANMFYYEDNVTGLKQLVQITAHLKKISKSMAALGRRVERMIDLVNRRTFVANHTDASTLSPYATPSPTASLSVASESDNASVDAIVVHSDIESTGYSSQNCADVSSGSASPDPYHPRIVDIHGVPEGIVNSVPPPDLPVYTTEPIQMSTVNLSSDSSSTSFHSKFGLHTDELQAHVHAPGTVAPTFDPASAVPNVAVSQPTLLTNPSIAPAKSESRPFLSEPLWHAIHADALHSIQQAFPAMDSEIEATISSTMTEMGFNADLLRSPQLLSSMEKSPQFLSQDAPQIPAFRLN